MDNPYDNSLVQACVNDDFKLAEELLNNGVEWPFSNDFIRFGCLNSERINDFLIEKKLIIIPKDTSIWDHDNHMGCFNNYDHYIIHKDLRIKQYDDMKEKIRKKRYTVPTTPLGMSFNELDISLVDACYNTDLKRAEQLVNKGAKWIFNQEFPNFDFAGSKHIVDFLFKNKLLLVKEFKNYDGVNHALYKQYDHYINRGALD